MKKNNSKLVRRGGFLIRNSILFLLLSLFLSMGLSCDITNPANTTLVFELKEIASTEVWLTLKSELKPLPLNITITNNNNFFKNITLTTNDTVLLLDSLKPLNNYV